ncbi:hypothetical protein [Brevundimonas sp.]|uniref:hypothetical protein n=1 Tax=Brevundimonas sp. TaxID=1871086 RepID=UPI0035ADC379
MIDRRLTPRSFSLALLAGSCLMSACAAFPELEATVARPSGGAYAPGDETLESPVEGAEQRLADRLAIPGGGDEQPRRPEITPEEAAALVGSGPPVSATLPPQTVPELVNAAFGDILAVPFSMGPGVASRNQLVALRGSPQMDRLAFFRLVQTALRDQGVRVHLEGGSLAVSDDFAAGGGAASVIRGRSSVPTAARNVVQFFEVQTIEAQALFSLAEGLTPNNGVSIAVDQPSNALILRGGAREVAQTAAILRELDQTRFAGQQVLRIQPIYFSAEGLRTALRDVLSAEGYQVSVTAGVPRPIVLLSLPEANQLLVFTSDSDLLERVNFWIDELDQPARFGDSTTTFVYQVNNTDAQTLGSLATGQQVPQAQPRTPTGVPGSPPRDTSLANLAALTAFRAAGNQGEGGGQQNFIPGGQQFLGGRLLIDPVGNRILFTGTANDYAQLRTLLTTLDVPAKQVLIEVTVAEVTLNDQTRAGLNFFFTESGSDGTLTGGTGGTNPGLELGGTGFNLDFTGIDLRAAFNAFASNNKVNILSTPRIFARSGGQARIQVGNDVPIITSQRAADSQSNGDTDILQTVQYRQTGVILDVQPVVYGDNRVDLIISQEVSTVADGGSGSAIASPIIGNRSLTTQISLNEGSTGVLGGLIDNTYSKGNSGVPFLKDIPLLGSAFRVDTIRGDQTILVILVTPFIMRNPEDMELFAAQYAAEMNNAFRVGRGWSYTLTPFSGGRGVGFNLPRQSPPTQRPETERIAPGVD